NTTQAPDPLARILASGENASGKDDHGWCSTFKVSFCFPVCTSQRRIVGSCWPPVLASVFPSGEKARPTTSSLCPSNVHFNLPVRGSQPRTVFPVPLPPLASILPSGENASENTPVPYLCPFLSTCFTLPLSTSSSSISPIVPMASVFSSGEKAS